MAANLRRHSISGGGGGGGGPSGESLTVYRGALTKAGAGVVNIGATSASPFVATASTYTLISGTSGHWTTPTDGTFPSPTTTGDTADLNGGPYVFSYTATDGGTNSRSGTLTINARANTYTASLISEIAAVKTAGIDGKTVEFARGATDFASATAGSPIGFSHWRATSTCTIKHEDSANPCTVGNLAITFPNNIKFDGITVAPSGRSSAAALEKSWDINTTGTPTGDEATSNILTLNNCGVSGIADPTKTTRFYVLTGGGPITLNFTGTTDFRWIQKINFNDAADKGITISRAGQIRVRYWTMDAFIITEGASELGTYDFTDLLFMSPMYDTTQGSIHPDTIQFPDSVNCKNVTIDTLTMIQADGDSIGQTIFSSNSTKLGLQIKNAISVGRSHHSLTISGTDASHTVDVINYTAVTQWSGIYGSTDTPGTVVNPGTILSASVDPTYLRLNNIWMQGALNNSSTYVPTSDVVHIASSTGDISAYLPNAGWISSSSLRTTALANNVANYTGLADSRWTADTDTVLASVVSALTPSSGQVGAVMSDGSRPLSIPPPSGVLIIETAPVTNSSASSTSVSTSFTPAGSAGTRRIVVAAEWNGSGGSAMTCTVAGGTTVSMNQIGIKGSGNNVSGSNEGIALFELAEADWPTGASFTITATVTHTGTPTSMGIEAVTIQNSPNAAAGTQTAGSTNWSSPSNVSVTPSAANSLVVGAFGLSTNSSSADWTAGLTRLSTPFRYPATPAKTAAFGSAVQGASALTVTSPTLATRGMMVVAYFAP